MQNSRVQVRRPSEKGDAGRTAMASASGKPQPPSRAMRALVVSNQGRARQELIQLLRDVRPIIRPHHVASLAEMILAIQSGPAWDLVLVDVDNVGPSWPDRLAWLHRRHPATTLVAISAAALPAGTVAACGTRVPTFLLRKTGVRSLRKGITEALDASAGPSGAMSRRPGAVPRLRPVIPA